MLTHTNPAFHQADRSQVAIPAFDRVLLDVPVAAEQLHAVAADLHAVLGAQLPGQRRLAGEGSALLGAARRPVGGKPHAFEFDADVGHHEGDGLPMADRFAECHPVVDVGDHVVENGLRGADGQRAPADARESDAVGVGGGVAEQGAARQGHAGQVDSPHRRGAQPHGRVGLDGDARRAGFEQEHCRAPIEVRRDHEQLGLGRPRHERLDAVEHIPVDRPPGGGLQGERVEQCSGFEHRQGGRGYVVADEGRQIGGLLRLVAPQDQGRAHRGRREARECQTHVAMGQRLGHENVRDRRTLAAGAAEVLGHADDRDAEFGGRLVEQSGRCGAVGVGRGRCGPQLLGSELGADLANHALLVGRGEVEEGALRRAVEPLRARLPVQRRERAACRRERREAGPARLEHRSFEGPAQSQPVKIFDPAARLRTARPYRIKSRVSRVAM